MHNRMSGLFATEPVSRLYPYKTLISSERHQVCAKSLGHTNMIERFNCALRQRVSRLAPGASSFSKMIKNHIGAIKCFICHYNKVIIGLAESALHL
jgi:IS1 family transposase